jgi:hypothetical protein
MAAAGELRALAQIAYLRQPKIGQMRHALIIEQDVRRLDITMDDLQRMSMHAGERGADVTRDLHRLFDWQAVRVPRQQAGQVAAGHVLHDQQQIALVVIGGQGAHDIRHAGGVQRRANLNLALVAPLDLVAVAGQQVAARLLDGDEPAGEGRLLGQPDAGHPPFADEFDDAVFVQNRFAGCDGHAISSSILQSVHSQRPSCAIRRR